MENRILELAIEALERRREQVNAEIEAIRAEMADEVRAVPEELVKAGGRRHKTPAERKAHSERMKKIWAARKSTDATSKPAKSEATVMVQDDAANRARSEKMKAYWAKKNARKARKSK